MNITKELSQRSQGTCELCGSSDELAIYQVPPTNEESIDNCIHICNVCKNQIDSPEKINPNHWRCLNDSMWSETPAVQVIAWRMLDSLKDEGWPNDLLDMLYLPDEILEWAKATKEDEDAVKHIDANGVQLQAGDSVVLIKDLNVKGSSMVAKRGTAVRNISLDRDNAEFIEGRVNSQHIVILTKYVKKT